MLFIYLLIDNNKYTWPFIREKELYYRKIFYCVTRDQKNKRFKSDYL